ncbi:MAG: ABZJ_00895 family protein [Paracoccaceae bacterium]
MNGLARPPRAEALAAFAKTYAWTSVLFAVLFGVFEQLFGWGLGLLGALVPALIASNRAAEVFARRRKRAPEREEAWRMAIEMGVMAAAVGLLLVAGLVVPLVLLSGRAGEVAAGLATLAPGTLTASAVLGAAIVAVAMRLVWPWQVRQALGK